MKRKIYIVGIGLIGGSFALEIRNIYPQSEIIGIDESEDNLNQAIELNLIDDKSEIDKILNPDIVLIAVPVNSIITVRP